MLSPDRPPPRVVLREQLQAVPFAKLKPTTTAYCEACAKRIGIVLDTTHGHLWVGIVDNRAAGRERSAGGGLTRGLEAQWLEPHVFTYVGDCDCPRRRAFGPLVFDAVQSGRRKVQIPVEEDRDTPWWRRNR